MYVMYFKLKPKARTEYSLVLPSKQLRNFVNDYIKNCYSDVVFSMPEKQPKWFKELNEAYKYNRK